MFGLKIVGAKYSHSQSSQIRARHGQNRGYIGVATGTPPYTTTGREMVVEVEDGANANRHVTQ